MMKLVFEVKTESVTQESSIVIGVVAVAFMSLAPLPCACAVYVDYPFASIICAIVLVMIIYLPLWLIPCQSLSSMMSAMEPLCSCSGQDGGPAPT